MTKTIISRYLSVISLILTTCFLSFGQERNSSDTLQYKEQYTPFTKEEVELVLAVFDGKQPSEIITKAEILISTGKDDYEKGMIAYNIYEYYRNSKYMGYDEIAIYFADNYILNFKYPIPKDVDFFGIKMYAEFNRLSLIGMNAQDLIMQDPSGANISILNRNQDYTVLYFYEDECPSCARTTPALMQYLSKVRGINFSVYMIYTKDNRENWMNYIKTFVHPFKISDNIKIIHLWDPEFSSDFPTKYGVISTPSMFLLDRNNIIIGRGLTPIALSQLVDLQESIPTSMESALEQLFQPIQYTSDTTVVCNTIDKFFEDSKDNPEFFHELFYSMYQFLKANTNYTFQQGAMYLAQKYIVGMPSLWESVIFTSNGESKGSVIRAEYQSVEEFIKETELAIELFYRNPLGHRITDLRLYTNKNKETNIHSIKAKYTVIYFYSLSCGVCTVVTQELEKIYKEYKDKGLEIIAIYTGKDKKWKKYIKENKFDWVNLWDSKGKSGMYEKFDLLDVPAIYFLDENQITIAKDINPDVVSALMEYYTVE